MRKESIIIWGIGLLILAVVAFGIYKSSSNPQSLAQTLSEPILNTDHSEGDVQSKAVLVEYGDFQCPACGAYFPIIEKINSDYAGKLLYVFRNFPLPQHANAMPAAYAAGAASNQGKFWEMYRQLYEHQNDWADKSNPSDLFLTYARAINLNIPQYQKDLTSTGVSDKVAHDMATGNASQINATPTFFLNGTAIHPQSYDEFKKLIDAALAAK